LSINSIESYDLNLFLSPYEFNFSVIDPIENRCLRLEAIRFKEAFSPEKNAHLLLDFFKQNTILPAGFWGNIQVFIAGRDYTLVPKEFFDKDSEATYISLNTNYNPDKQTVSSEIIENTVVVYSYEKKIEELFQKVYPNKQIHFKTFVANVLKNPSQEADVLYLYQDENLLTLLVYKNHQMHYLNTFSYKNTDDILYYTLLIFKELDLNHSSFKTIISGNSDSLNILQLRLSKYIQNIELGKRPSNLKLCHNFDQIEENRFFNILNAKHHE
jgi:hypothetical protein